MTLWSRSLRISALALALCACFLCRAACAQEENPEGIPTGPAAALSDALTAACTQNQTEFANDLTSESAAAFRALASDLRVELMQRFSLADEPGKPLLSSDDQNHVVLRCSTPSNSVEFRFGAPRVQDNLAFVPVRVVKARQTQFGLVRENGRWRVLSVGLLLIDIPQLAKQWEQQAFAPKEEAVVKTMRGLKSAVERYQRAFGKLPQSLAQLGPAPPGEISPDEASLISKGLAAGDAGGYRFQYQLVTPAASSDQTFEITATPDDYGKTGLRSFFMDAAGEIHAADKQGVPATGADPVLEAATTD